MVWIKGNPRDLDFPDPYMAEATIAFTQKQKNSALALKEKPQ